MAYAMIDSRRGPMRPFQLENCVGFLSISHPLAPRAGSNSLRVNILNVNELRQLPLDLKKSGTELSL
jgi:hypothetical protein